MAAALGSSDRAIARNDFNNPSKRKLSTPNAFHTIKDLFDAILQNSVRIDQDWSVSVNAKDVIVGSRENIPFVIDPSDKVRGEGNFGIVHEGKLYRYIDQTWGVTSVAIKTPIDKDDQEEFIWEEQVHSMIGHIKHVQQLLLSYRINDEIALVSHLRDGPISMIVDKPFAEKIRYFEQLNTALIALKDAGFYFTDIKPGNFLFSSYINQDGDTEVVDLSSACHLPKVQSNAQLKDVKRRLFMGGELNLAREFQYISVKLWDDLTKAHLRNLKDYADFKMKVEQLMTYSLLLTFYELSTNRLPSENDKRAVCNEKNPIDKKAQNTLEKAGCPKDIAAEFISYLRLETPMKSMSELQIFLLNCQLACVKI